MSVVFGIKENNNVIIASDRRGSSFEGKFITDDMDKLIVVSEHLAFCSAGNAVFDKLISMKLDRDINRTNFTTEDLSSFIENVVQNVISNGVLKSQQLTFKCIIAGKGRKENISLITGGIFKGKLEFKEVPVVLYPPSGMSLEECNAIFCRNYYMKPEQFIEQTIMDISKKSDLVSAIGNKWIYNAEIKNGTLYEF